MLHFTTPAAQPHLSMVGLDLPQRTRCAFRPSFDIRRLPLLLKVLHARFTLKQTRHFPVTGGFLSACSYLSAPRSRTKDRGMQIVTSVPP